MRFSVKLSIITVGMTLAVITGLPTIAMGAANIRANAQTESTSDQLTNAGSQATDHKAGAETKLADAKLKACQKREKAVNNS